jgi:hypothetical protein
MTVFNCRRCGAAVSGEVTETVLPNNPPVVIGDDGEAVPRLEPGSFAVDPEAFGPPSVPTADDPNVLMSAGPRGTILLNPGDIRNVIPHPDLHRRNGCCRLDGLDGPNLVCAGCGIDVATEQSDCWVNWLDIRLEPDAVIRSNQTV